MVNDTIDGERYRPWPLTALAGILLMGGLVYIYDLAALLLGGSLRWSIALMFVIGTAVCWGLGWGVWRLEVWARIAVVWLCVVAIGSIIFAVPLILLARPSTTDVSVIYPAFVLGLVAFVLLRYLGSAEARRAFDNTLPTNPPTV